MRGVNDWNMVSLMFRLFLSLSGLLVLSSCSHQATDSQPPNVVFIMVDDLGWKDVGYMDGSFFHTPNIDGLASEGMVFTQAYASAANCAPSRACLMTGQHTPRHGMYTVGSSERGKASKRKLIPTPNKTEIPFSTPTMGDLFQQAGYVCGTFGKWHISQDPLQQGFEVNMGGDLRGNPGKGGYFSPYNVSHFPDGPEGEHLTDRLTSEAISFIEDHQDTSFFLYLPFYDVHTPLQAKENLRQKYQEKAAQNLKGIHPVYAAMVENMDMNIGRILTTLTELGIEENTLLVFTSDNGGIASLASQHPLRAGKGSYFEGGIRVPLIMKWPAQIPVSRKVHTPVTNLDFYPTFSHLLDIQDESLPLDGQDLSPLWKGKQLEERALYWHFPIYLQAYDGAKDEARDPWFRTRPGSVMRKGKWKLHQYFEDNEVLLYDLENDLGESINLADSLPEIASTLLSDMKSWQQEIMAPIPIEKNPLYLLEN